MGYFKFEREEFSISRVDRGNGSNARVQNGTSLEIGKMERN